MAIHHRVHQLAALPPQPGRAGTTGPFGQPFGQRVAGGQPHQPGKAAVRHPGAGMQQVGCRVQRGANHQGGASGTHAGNFRHGNAALGQVGKPGWVEMTIQRARQIRQHHREQAKRFNPGFQRVQIARRQHGRRQHIDLAAGLPGAAAGGNQFGNQPFHRQGKTAFQAAQRVRRIDRHHRHACPFRMLLAKHLQRAVNVRALHFGQPCGHQADECRLFGAGNGIQCFDNRVVRTHHRDHVIDRRGL